MTSDGTDAIADFLAAGVDIAGVNVMTMDYGDSRAADQSMLDATTDALQATHRQLGVLYSQADIDLTDATLWSKIGATPMIGQNDVRERGLQPQRRQGPQHLRPAAGHVARMSMWSLNRDATCGSNYVDLSRVSDACSGVDQGDQTLRGAARRRAHRLTAGQLGHRHERRDPPAAR